MAAIPSQGCPPYLALPEKGSALPPASFCALAARLLSVAKGHGRLVSTGARVPVHQRGFTLLEMIFVLVIMAMMAGLLGGSIVGRLDSVRVATAARDLTAALRHTRSQAILLHKEQFLEVDLEKRSYLAPGRPKVVLPEQLEVKLLTATAEASSEKQGRIRFFPDGGSTGGRVTLIAGEREWKVSVSWLTGEIEMDDGRKGRGS